MEVVPRLPPQTRERIAYVAIGAASGTNLEIAVLDVDRRSPRHGQILHRTALPEAIRDVSSLAFNRSDSTAPDRYLLLTSPTGRCLCIIDTHPDPYAPQVAHIVTADEFADDAEAEPKAICCRGNGLGIFWVSPSQPAGAVAILDPQDYARQRSNGLAPDPGECSYGFACHPVHGTVVTSAWGSAEMAAAGLRPDLLMSAAYGHSLHVWDVVNGTHEQEIRLGDQATVLELCAANDPARSYGFAAVTASLEDLSAAVWIWHRDDTVADGKRWQARKVIELPAETAPSDGLPQLLSSFGAVPPLVTHLDLTDDDRYLLVSCWGSGELKRYDVSNPFAPTLTDSVRLGGVLCETPHPASPNQILGGGPGRSLVNADGSRVYVASSISAPWDEQFYPRGAEHWLARVDVDPDGTMGVDSEFFPDLKGSPVLALCLAQ
ncbi:MAG: selenium-binding protein [Acidobacteria bacterium]|nr:selenium-binding protein [Acidobacteriota bacterium]